MRPPHESHNDLQLRLRWTYASLRPARESTQYVCWAIRNIAYAQLTPTDMLLTRLAFKPNDSADQQAGTLPSAGSQRRRQEAAAALQRQETTRVTGTRQSERRKQIWGSNPTIHAPRRDTDWRPPRQSPGIANRKQNWPPRDNPQPGPQAPRLPLSSQAGVNGRARRTAPHPTHGRRFGPLTPKIGGPARFLW